MSLIAIGCVGGDESGDGDDTQFEGCGSDLDCRGDRICEDRKCVDPDAPDDAQQTLSSGGDGDGDGSAGSDGGDGDGDGDSGATQSGNGSDVIDDPELEAACIRDCEAKHAANCEMPIGSLDQCMGQCLVIDEAYYGYCLDERREQYDCLADGGYTCVNGYPQPKSTCIAEAQALSTCTQETPCRRLCVAFEGTDCVPDSDCFEACRQEEQGFEDLICSYDYTRLITCWGQNPSCDGDLRSLESCNREAAEVADCVGLRTGECEGYCKAAELLGCAPSDCVESCQPKLDDSSCGYLYRRFIECSYDSYEGLYLECQDGAAEPTSECDSERMEYDACMAQ